MEEKYKVALEIISYAGDAKANYMLALGAAEQYDFQQAEELIATANSYILQAHQCQTDMIREEAAGIPAEVNIIMIHAQDHLSMAAMAKEHVLGLIKVYRRMQTIELQMKIETMGEAGERSAG